MMIRSLIATAFISAAVAAEAPAPDERPALAPQVMPGPIEPPPLNLTATTPMSANDVQLLINLAVANDRLARAQAEQQQAANAAADVTKKLEATMRGAHGPAAVPPEQPHGAQRGQTTPPH